MIRGSKPGDNGGSGQIDGNEPESSCSLPDRREGGRISRGCVICNHPQRIDIDRLLAGNPNCSEIARDYGISYNTVLWHRDRHLTRQMMKAVEIREVTHIGTIANDIHSVYHKVMSLLAKAERTQKSYLFLEAAKELRAYAEFLIRLEQTFRTLQQEEEAKAGERYRRADAVVIDVSRVGDQLLDELYKLIAQVRTEEGLPIAAERIRDTLH